MNVDWVCENATCLGSCPLCQKLSDRKHLQTHSMCLPCKQELSRWRNNVQGLIQLVRGGNRGYRPWLDMRMYSTEATKFALWIETDINHIQEALEE